ncbi:TIGR03757 family integrating conjugative element protein [Pasteurella multocida]|nr:TIGR03757 family integrating conjugative element protein [Pasteurella multocida]HDX1167842.1 TIGR03757 family integrating conjugative element protein [Pasteurella multocida]
MFKHLIPIVPLYLLLNIPSMAQAVTDVTISVFTTAAYPITHQSLANHIYLLDGPEQWEAQISKGLSSNPIQAEQQAKQRFQSADMQANLDALQRAYQGVIIGWQTGIRKVPAVLFDSPQFGQAVIYGVNDVAQAKAYWEKWYRQHSQEK